MLSDYWTNDGLHSKSLCFKPGLKSPAVSK
jgi:hypothetical protein